MKRLIPATVALMLVLAVGSNPATAKVNSSPVDGECPPPFVLGDVPTFPRIPAADRADRDGDDLVCSFDVQVHRPRGNKTIFIDDR